MSIGIATIAKRSNRRAYAIEAWDPPYDWSDWLNRFAASRVRVSLDFDVDYGIHKRSGWSFTIDGACLSEFRLMPEEAVEEAIVKWIVYGEDAKDDE